MLIKIGNFEMSSDIKNMSEDNFKAHMKELHGVSATEAKKLYKKLQK